MSFCFRHRSSQEERCLTIVSSHADQVLPKSDRMLLRWMGYIVPSRDRQDWLRSWEAELWWRRYATSPEAHRELRTDLSIGLCLDAFWLHLDNWRGTATRIALVASLALADACFFAIFFNVCLYGGWYRPLLP